MSGVLAAYRRILRNRSLSWLLLGEFVSSIGDWLYLVALLIIIYDRTQDVVLLGIVGAARVLPYVLLSIPAGIVADRYDRRLVLLVTDLARGALMVVLAWLVATEGSIVAIVAITILATCCSAFFGPALGAYMPSLVKDERDLGPANTAYSTLDNLAYIGGPALAAIIISLGSLALAFVLNAITFLFVAVILWRLPSTTGTPAGPAPVTAEDAPLGTTAVLRRIRVPLAAIMVVDLMESFVFGGLGVLTVVIAFEHLGIGDEGTGLLNAALGVGGLIGAIIAGALVLRRWLVPPMLLGALLLGAAVVVIGLSEQVPIVAIAFAVVATGSLLLSVVATTIVQRLVPGEMLGRVLGVMGTTSVLAYACGALLLPALSSSLGITPVLVTLGSVAGLTALVVIPMLGVHAVQALPDDPVRAMLGAVPQFSGLSPARLERAERRARVVTMTPGQVLIRQGDVADRFYVIAEGTVSVTQVPGDGDPSVTLREMGPGEVFGEIGLLAGVARTATVTAVGGGRLLTLDAATFLELVGNGPGLTFPLLDVHRGATLTGG